MGCASILPSGELKSLFALLNAPSSCECEPAGLFGEAFDSLGCQA